ncbi:hypothetical protein MCOR07_002520 [Pyricularia oryzae]|nr:hypothetical protein MCOR23_002768 [Pyricularia oryzae]KAI6410955.1 hypothetical protein MCOR20_004474 [Pyricularia oryzae]KAI6626251.1 hypothetical protein MCOR07_002520 [Pyricularia oryzae]
MCNITHNLCIFCGRCAVLATVVPCDSIKDECMTKLQLAADEPNRTHDIIKYTTCICSTCKARVEDKDFFPELRAEDKREVAAAVHNADGMSFTGTSSAGNERKRRIRASIIITLLSEWKSERRHLPEGVPATNTSSDNDMCIVNYNVCVLCGRAARNTIVYCDAFGITCAAALLVEISNPGSDPEMYERMLCMHEACFSELGDRDGERMLTTYAVISTVGSLEEQQS